MANCVAFTTTNSVPSVYKNSGTRPASNNSSGRARFRIPAYPAGGSFGDLLGIEGTATQYMFMEFDSTGTLYAVTRQGSSPASNTQNIWTDSYTGWFDAIWVCSSAGFHVSVRRAGGGWTDISPCSAVTYTTSSIRIAGSFLFPNDCDAQHKVAVLEVFSTATPGGSSDLAGARTFLKGLCDSRRASGDAATIFYNPFLTGGDCHTDYSATAANFTATGSSTSVTNDDPGFTDGDAAGSIAITSTVSAVAPASGVGAGAIAAAVTVSGVGRSLNQAAGSVTVTSSLVGTSPNTTNLLLEASANGRYFVNANGEPFFLFGDAAWSIITNLTDAEQEDYLDDRQARGINCLLIQLIENEFGPSPPNNTDAEAPFTGTAFQTSLNEDYWSRVDDFFEKCAERGMVCVVNPVYIGFDDDQGWGAEVNAASTGQMTTYGTTLGTRYKDFDGIIWCLYGDRNAYGSKMDACVTGLQAGDNRHTLYTTHYSRPTSTHDATVPSWVTCDFLYAATGLAHVEGSDGWTADIGPMFLGESRYEHATGIDAFDVRRACWQAALSGALGGVIVGNEGIWAFDTPFFPGLEPWEDYLDDHGLVHSAHLATLFASVRFQNLIPEFQSATFVTAGRGTHGSDAWVPASRNGSTATLAIAYIPGGASITINMALMAGSTTARWYDPTSGQFTNATGSPLANSGTHAFVASSEVGTNDAGGTDWALVLEVANTSGAGAITGAATVTGVGRSTAAAVGAVAAAGTVAGVGRAVALAAGAVAATGTVAGVGAAAGRAAGSITASVVATGVGAARASSVAAITATGTVAAVGAGRASAVGQISATLTLSASSDSSSNAVGAISASCSMAGVGLAAFRAAGSISAQLTCTGVGAVGLAVGAISVGVTVSGVSNALADASGSIDIACTVLGVSITETMAPPTCTMTIATGPSSSMTIASSITGITG